MVLGHSPIVIFVEIRHRGTMDGVVLTTLNLILTEDHRTRADTMIMSEGKN